MQGSDGCDAHVGRGGGGGGYGDGGGGGGVVQGS